MAAELPAGGTQSAALNEALADRPAGGGAIVCEVKPISDGLLVTVRTEMPPLDADEVAVVEAGESGLWISQAVLERSGDRLSAMVEMVPPDGKPFALSRADVRMTVIGGGDAIEMEGCD